MLVYLPASGYINVAQRKEGMTFFSPVYSCLNACREESRGRQGGGGQRAKCSVVAIWRREEIAGIVENRGEDSGERAVYR